MYQLEQSFSALQLKVHELKTIVKYLQKKYPATCHGLNITGSKGDLVTKYSQLILAAFPPLHFQGCPPRHILSICMLYVSNNVTNWNTKFVETNGACPNITIITSKFQPNGRLWNFIEWRGFFFFSFLLFFFRSSWSLYIPRPAPFGWK